jgi:hypothetical protein
VCPLAPPASAGVTGCLLQMRTKLEVRYAHLYTWPPLATRL